MTRPPEAACRDCGSEVALRPVGHEFECADGCEEPTEIDAVRALAAGS